MVNILWYAGYSDIHIMLSSSQWWTQWCIQKYRNSGRCRQYWYNNTAQWYIDVWKLAFYNDDTHMVAYSQYTAVIYTVVDTVKWVDAYSSICTVYTVVMTQMCVSSNDICTVMKDVANVWWLWYEQQSDLSLNTSTWWIGGWWMM